MPSSLACVDLPARLRALERAAGDGASAAGAQELRRHLGVCAPCQHAHGARLTTLEGLCALRSRQVPGGLLEDLRSRVLTQVRTSAASSVQAASVHAGGMSATFLDAPASLARWRRVALAASVLLAVGVGLVASGRLSLVPERGAQDRELRDALLPRLDARRGPELGDTVHGDTGRGETGRGETGRGETGRGEEVLQPVMLPGHGMRGYFVGRPTPPRDAAAQPNPAALQPNPAAPGRLAPETGD